MGWLTSGSCRQMAVIGASGGIGAAFVEHLAGAGHEVWSLSRRRPEWLGTSMNWQAIDLEDEDTIAKAAASISGELDLVIVAAGILSDGDGLKPEKTWRHLDAAAMARVYAINTIGPALCAKHFLPKLPRQRPSVFAALSARVGSIEDNGLGGWHSYRASKAALNMLLKTCSIELRIRCPKAACIGLHPGTVDTGLSKPFQDNVKPNKLFGSDYAVSRMVEVIDRTGSEHTGQIFDYSGDRIPY